MLHLRTATTDDLPTIVDTAARSLDAEAMLRWSFGEERFRDRIRRHFTYYDGENERNGMPRSGDGWVITSRRNHSCISATSGWHRNASAKAWGAR